MIVFVVSQRGRPLAVLAQARSTKKDSVRLELNIFTALKPLLFTWETRHWNTQQMRIFIKAINTPFVLCLTQNWNLKTCQGSWQVAYCHNGRWGKTVNTVVCEGTNQYWQVNVYFSCVFFYCLGTNLSISFWDKTKLSHHSSLCWIAALLWQAHLSLKETTLIHLHQRYSAEMAK